MHLWFLKINLITYSIAISRLWKLLLNLSLALKCSFCCLNFCLRVKKFHHQFIVCFVWLFISSVISLRQEVTLLLKAIFACWNQKNYHHHCHQWCFHSMTMMTTYHKLHQTQSPSSLFWSLVVYAFGFSKLVLDQLVIHHGHKILKLLAFLGCSNDGVFGKWNKSLPDDKIFHLYKTNHMRANSVVFDSWNNVFIVDSNNGGSMLVHYGGEKNYVNKIPADWQF